MKPVVKKVVRFRSMYAWANRILRIDLSNMDIEVQEAEFYPSSIIFSPLARASPGQRRSS